MKIAFYDHEPRTDLCDIDYHVCVGYRDALKFKDKNYLFLDDCKLTDDLSQRSIEYLYHFSNMGLCIDNFKGKENIKEIISFEGHSLWWFFEANNRKEVESYLKYVEMLKAGLDGLDISSITCDIRDETLLWAVRTYSEKRDIQLVNISPLGSRKFSRLRCIRLVLGYIGRVLLTYIINSLVYGFHNKDKEAPLIIASYPDYWTKFNVTKDMQKDGIFHEIQQALDANGIKYTGLELDGESLINYIRVQISKNNFERGKWIPMTSFADLGNIFRAIKSYSRIVYKISNTYTDDADSRFIMNLIKNYIIYLFYPTMGIYLLKSAMETLKPQAILTSCEYCIMGRCAIMVGNEKNIPTIALQHGIINPTHYGYIFPKQENTTYGLAVDFRPLPRYTLLNGNKYRDILSKKSTYPLDSLIVTGQPRLDYLYRLEKSFDKSKFLESYGLKSPLIVWISTVYESETEARSNIECFKKALEEWPNFSLFIKPHPVDMNVALYDPLLKYKNVTVSKDVNLYQLIACSSLVVTKESTTGTEALALNKPLIVLNLSGAADAIDYVKEGVAFGVYRREDLLSAIKTLLKDDSELRKNRNKYVEETLYKVDGRSGERVARFIEDLYRAKKPEGKA